MANGKYPDFSCEECAPAQPEGDEPADLAFLSVGVDALKAVWLAAAARVKLWEQQQHAEYMELGIARGWKQLSELSHHAHALYDDRDRAEKAWLDSWHAYNAARVAAMDVGHPVRRKARRMGKGVPS